MIKHMNSKSFLFYIHPILLVKTPIHQLKIWCRRADSNRHDLLVTTPSR